MASPVYGVLALAITIVALAVVSGRFDYDPALFSDGILSTALVVTIASAMRWVGFERLATFVEMAILSVTLPITMAFASLVLASSALPWRDDTLAVVDLWIFAFDRRDVAPFLMRWPQLSMISGWIYNSLAITPYLLLSAAIWLRQMRLAWTIMASLAVTAMVAMLIMPLVPALGSPPYGYRFVDIFEAVRSGGLRRFDGAAITGLVTFPSVHAADGVLLAWGYSRFGPWLLPLTILHILMIGSALLTGGHYLIDLFAGVAIAVSILRLMTKISTRLDRGMPYR